MAHTSPTSIHGRSSIRKPCLPQALHLILLLNVSAADPPKAEEAIRWFYPSASAGNARAQYNLGLCLQNGKGVKQNQKEAAKWYLRAAEGGNVRAMYNISLCYSYGEGLGQDPVRAKRWLQLAADCGHKKALYECGIKLCAVCLISFS
ncbi:F-box protein [Zea mays]|uniref:F-box protein n=1 Tax=Zea mays TaxID=4577 RepID=A0A1D6FKW2_MAIZE|nr:F-box protein [Zea mays]